MSFLLRTFLKTLQILVLYTCERQPKSAGLSFRWLVRGIQSCVSHRLSRVVHHKDGLVGIKGNAILRPQEGKRLGRARSKPLDQRRIQQGADIFKQGTLAVS